MEAADGIVGDPETVERMTTTAETDDQEETDSGAQRTVGLRDGWTQKGANDLRAGMGR